MWLCLLIVTPAGCPCPLADGLMSSGRAKGRARVLSRFRRAGGVPGQEKGGRGTGGYAPTPGIAGSSGYHSPPQVPQYLVQAHVTLRQGARGWALRPRWATDRAATVAAA